MAERSIALDEAPAASTAAHPAAASGVLKETATRGRRNGTVTRNPVIAAAAKISTILDGLDASTRTSVVNFIAQQYLV